MKIKFFYQISTIVATALVLTACEPNEKCIKFNLISEEKTLYPDDTLVSFTPGYDIELKMQFLKPTAITAKSACNEINNKLMETVLGGYEKCTDIDKMVKTFMKDQEDEYREMTCTLFSKAAYEAIPPKRNPDPNDFYYTTISGTGEFGFEGIINYSILKEEYLGGAHPTSRRIILCFNANTGKQIKKEDVFRNDKSKELSEMLTAKLMEEKGVSTMKELNDLGYLEFERMFITENFSLEKDKVVFFYNLYDIAPYAAGTTTLSFSYEELKDVLM